MQGLFLDDGFGYVLNCTVKIILESLCRALGIYDELYDNIVKRNIVNSHKGKM